MLSQARKKYEWRSSECKEQVDKTFMEDIDTFHKRTRVTLAEYCFMEGLLTAIRDAEKGKGMLNSQIEQLPDGKLQMSDLHPAIWELTRKCLGGQSWNE